MNPTSLNRKTKLPLHPVTLVPADYDFQTILAEGLGMPSDDLTAYKVYDSAVIGWIKRRFTMDGNTLPIIPSAPSNAFADYRTLLTTLGFAAKCPNDVKAFASYPLPMISVNRTGEDVRDGNAGGYPLRLLRYQDAQRRTAMFTRYPKAMSFMYSINLWANRKDHMAWMKQTMEMSFWNKVATTRISHVPQVLQAPPQITAMHRESMEDVNSEQRSEREELILRTVFKIRVEAWMWDDILAAPTTLQYGEQIVDQATDIVIGDVLRVLSPDAPAITTPTGPPGDEVV